MNRSRATAVGDEQSAVTLPTGSSRPQEPTPDPQEVAAGLEPGATVGQYELIRELGSGGMGTVFLARDTRLGRKVAIKFLHTSDDAELTQRFILEARATASCNHENIVVIHEVGEHEGMPFMVLEYLQGQSLKKLVGGQRVPPARAVELMVPVVRALACAHGQNIVHRDLKPDNVVVTETGTIKVLDFGIAKVLQPEQGGAAAGAGRAGAPDSNGDGGELTQAGSILGTLPFMAPEQWGSTSDLDHRVDIWAVGIMLFQMLAGRHPLAPLKGLQLMVTKDLGTTMPPLRGAAPEVPPELAAVVDLCLRKRREERFPDALSLMRALEPLLPGRTRSELKVEEAPYAGLSSFQESDADRFFGRTREIAALVNRLYDRPVMAVVGPSGAGKSSFIRAGVVPVLKRSGQSWETIIIRPGRDPLGALAATVAPLVASSTTLEDEIDQQRKLVQRIRAEPGYVGTVLRGRARREKSRILVFVDQTEELYTQVADPAERLAFTTCLAGVADDATAPTRVIVSLRSDFLDRVSEDERFMAEVTQGLFFLAAPQGDGLRDALVQPAEMAGYRFETPEMVERMLAGLGSIQGALPLLQFAATRLWEARDPARKLLTERAYAEMGGIEGALATHADSVLAALSAPEQRLVRALLLRLVSPERTRAIVPVEELKELSPDRDEVERLMQHLVQARLLVVQTGGPGAGATVELVHESLIQTWPMLKRWLDEGQEDAAFLEQLRGAARQWAAKHRSRDLLWRGDLVEEARRFRRRYRGELPSQQGEFLDAVLANAARASRLRRALAVGAVVVLVLGVAASTAGLVVVQSARKVAERQTKVAEQQTRAAEQHLVDLQESKKQIEQQAQDLKSKNDELRKSKGELVDTAAAMRQQALAATRAKEEALRAKELAERLQAEAVHDKEQALETLKQEQAVTRQVGYVTKYSRPGTKR